MQSSINPKRGTKIFSSLEELKTFDPNSHLNWSIIKYFHLPKYMLIWEDSINLDPKNLSIHYASGEKSLKRDIIYLKMAKSWSENSYCERMKVGCLIVNNKSIISDGYNGSPSGFPDICEDSNYDTLPYVLHAEANAITKLAKSTQSSEGSTIYVTLSPCFECSKLIIQSGIKRIVFSDLYRKPESIFFLAESGIEIVKINI